MRQVYAEPGDRGRVTQLVIEGTNAKVNPVRDGTQGDGAAGGEGHASRLGEEKANLAAPLAPGVESKAKSILLIEDDPDTAGALEEMLQDAGYTVRKADSGGAALREARDKTADLFLVDIALPDGNGIRLARILGERYGTPIVIMTALPSFELDEPLGSNPYVKFVLFKPCSNRTLLKTVQEALPKAPAA